MYPKNVNGLRSICLGLASVLLFLSGCNSAEPEKKEYPNILLIITDDQGWGDLGINGNQFVKTPVLDQLSGNSVNFKHFYVSPVCAPTRASLLTGRYHLRTGTTWVTHRKEVMRSEEVTLAEILKSAGYTTGIFGKWHNGAQFPHNPQAQGFDEFFGFCAGHWNNYFNTTLEHNDRMVPTQGYITDVLTNKAIEFIGKNKDQPFFCYLPYNAPHSPFQVPDKYFDKYKALGLEDKNAAVYGMCENIDENIGKILNVLDSLSLRENTIVLFLTDNGPNGKRYNGGMKGIKGSVDEGGIRVPLFIRWPGKLQEGMVVDQIASHIDILPTVLELIDVPHPDSLVLDGLSLLPLLNNEQIPWPARNIYTHQVNRVFKMTPGSVRTDRHRMIYLESGVSLFDLIDDPGQIKDIAAEDSQITESLRLDYESWFKEVTNHRIAPPPIQLGHLESPVVKLPAPEAKLFGNLQFKGGMGWANDYIINWKDPGDYALWEVEAVSDGEYEFSLQYTCTEDFVNSIVNVQMGSQSLSSSVVKAYDPKFIPSPDRIARGEVYEKPWQTLNLGIQYVEKGSHLLTISTSRTSSIPSLELKSVVITKIN